jgi:hypothetical protein
MQQRIRPAFVVTVSAMAVVACAAPRTRKASPPPDSGKSVQDLDYSKLDLLNPVDDKKHVIYASGEQCYVTLPYDEKPKYWHSPKVKQVDCPKSMDSAAWDQCHGGMILRVRSSGMCVCTRDGNPPPPPHEVTCP